MRLILHSLALTFALVAATAQAQSGGKVLTITRSVKIFSDLENRLDAAAAKHDEDALGKLLAPLFEQRNGANPGTPVPRAEWLTGTHPGETARAQMAVHEFGMQAIVSYQATIAKTSFFVVDVWNKTGEDWSLAVRYSSLTGTTAAPQAKPDGKQ